MLTGWLFRPTLASACLVPTDFPVQKTSALRVREIMDTNAIRDRGKFAFGPQPNAQPNQEDTKCLFSLFFSLFLSVCPSISRASIPSLHSLTHFLDDSVCNRESERKETEERERETRERARERREREKRERREREERERERAREREGDSSRSFRLNVSVLQLRNACFPKRSALSLAYVD